MWVPILDDVSSFPPVGAEVWTCTRLVTAAGERREVYRAALITEHAGGPLGKGPMAVHSSMPVPVDAGRPRGWPPAGGRWSWWWDPSAGVDVDGWVA